MAAVAAALPVAGSLLSGGASILGGIQENKEAKREGRAVFAQSTRQAYEERRTTDRLISDARATRAGGGGAFDAGSAERIGRIDEEGSYNALAALYEGQTKRDALKRRGKRALIKGVVSGVPSILDGVSKAFA